ncbi:fumarate hydratase [Pedobacter sp. N36a]|uniref:fumarate hydratase n=1 Tax=Pedobacter sp. N36a TaxID=2767996 RepID=UPI00165741E5|nr:fumarate hydratase [Pedobacter sp. N36a]MBC8985456.1 fumarate hydratase [Pedobacter sp. N36a]
MWRLILSLLLVSGLFASCSRLPNVQGKGEAFLQGVWNQDSIPHKEQLLNYTQHKFKFTCDSFYVDLTTYSKVNYYADSCFNNGVWKEYAKGVYEVRNDSLILEGTYTKANYKQKVTGCYQIGRYVRSFFVKSFEPNKLSLVNASDQRECNLVLKEKIVCEPKSL